MPLCGDAGGDVKSEDLLALQSPEGGIQATQTAVGSAEALGQGEPLASEGGEAVTVISGH